MKAHKNWSYRPYRSWFSEIGDIYICRVVPKKTSIYFEWIENPQNCEIYYKEREDGEFILAGVTDKGCFEISDLKPNAEYEFYVQADGKKSHVRLARVGECIGTVINYLHPEDTAYEHSGRFLATPSLVRHPEGHLLASMDVFGKNYPQNLTLIFRSDDNGKTWYYLNELFPCFWGKLFVHRNDLYMIAESTEYGDLLIGKSTDGGMTFGEPTVLLRGSNGKHGEAGVQKPPMPIVEHDGRLWTTFEWGSWGKGYHAAAVMSVSADSDLLDADNWSFSEPIKYNSKWEGLPQGESSGAIEGNIVAYGGELHSILRYDMRKLERKYGLVMDYKINTENVEEPLSYGGVIELPCNHSKFEIHYDTVSGEYIAIGSRITDPQKAGARNLVSLFASEDCVNWRVVCDVIDKRDSNHRKIGFQYMSMIFDGDDIIFQCRTSMNGADTHHNTNYSTFHRLYNFRNLL